MANSYFSYDRRTEGDKRKKMIIFYYKKMILGGAELLIMRLAKAMKKMGVNVCIISKSIEEELMLQLKDNDVQYCICRNPEKKITEFTKNEEHVRVITMFYVDYIRIRYLTRNVNNIKVIFYCVHMKGMIFGRPIPYPIKESFLKISRSFIEHGIINNSILLMDQETIERTKEYYLIQADFEINSIGLPYDFGENRGVIENQIDCKIQNDMFNIISIARADFPFKGYIIGLIQQFAIFNERHQESNLHIIASGKDENKIIQEIEKQRSSVKKHIIYYGKTMPSEMKKILSKMDVLVGMGTTLLDASSEGVLSIPVVPGYLECLCADTFFDENFLFSVMPKFGKNNLQKMFDDVLKMSKEDYFEKSLNSYSKAKEKFSTNQIAKILLEVEVEKNDKYIKLLNLYVLIDQIWKKFKR